VLSSYGRVEVFVGGRNRLGVGVIAIQLHESEERRYPSAVSGQVWNLPQHPNPKLKRSALLRARREVQYLAEERIDVRDN
jgi:hypothetical protein